MNWEKFCLPGETRYGTELTRPWIARGWKYATDARIAIRQPTQELDTDPTPLCAKLTDGYFEGWPSPGEQSLAAMAIMPTHGGEADTEYNPACMAGDSPSETACSKWGTCASEGDYDCDNVTPTRTPKPIEFAGHRWGGKYVELLNQEMPGARYCIDSKGLMRFFWQGIEGVLASMKGAERPERSE